MVADEAMKRAGKIYNGYAGRRADDPMGSEVVGKIIRSLESSGWVCVPREATEEMCQSAIDSLGMVHTNSSMTRAINAAIAAAPRLTGEKR